MLCAGAEILDGVEDCPYNVERYKCKDRASAFGPARNYGFISTSGTKRSELWVGSRLTIAAPHRSAERVVHVIDSTRAHVFACEIEFRIYQQDSFNKHYIYRSRSWHDASNASNEPQNGIRYA